MDFSNYLLISDLDGTLLSDDHAIPEKNLNAINYWTSNGGKFSIATGRSILSAKKHILSLDIDIPVILFNGGVLYDYKKEEIIWSNYLHENYYNIVLRAKEDYPNIGIEIMTLDTIYIINQNDIVYQHVDKEDLSYKNITDSVSPNNAIKILFGVPENEMNDFSKEMFKLKDDNFSFVQTSSTYFEMLPSNINKGDALNKFTSLEPYNNFYTIAIGDYNNDLKMIKNADLGVATGNALDIVKKSADIVVSDNNSQPIADVVNYIRSNNILKEKYDVGN